MKKNKRNGRALIEHNKAQKGAIMDSWGSNLL